MEQAYNSFVLLDNGRIVTKNLSDTHPAILSVVDPDTLRFAAPDTACPEPSVARLSAIGNRACWPALPQPWMLNRQHLTPSAHS